MGRVGLEIREQVKQSRLGVSLDIKSKEGSVGEFTVNYRFLF